MEHSIFCLDGYAGQKPTIFARPAACTQEFFDARVLGKVLVAFFLRCIAASAFRPTDSNVRLGLINLSSEVISPIVGSGGGTERTCS
jgi:hypothetical protein